MMHIMLSVLLGWSTPILPCENFTSDANISTWVSEVDSAYVVGILYMGNEPLGLTNSSTLEIIEGWEAPTTNCIMQDSSGSLYIESTTFVVPREWLLTIYYGSKLKILCDKGNVLEFCLPDSIVYVLHAGR